MTEPLATDAMTHRPRGNSYDAIRILAAASVLVSHHFALTGKPEPALGNIHSLGGMAVLVFFSLSGYLVTQSWLADPHAWRFVARRALRIWPALGLLCVLSVFFLGPLVTTLSLTEYFSAPGTWKYFYALRLKIMYVLPGVFETNAKAGVVNGSLWTIPIEVRCYVTVVVLGAVGLLRIRWLIPAAVVVAALWFIGVGKPEILGQRSYSREMFIFFFCGSALSFLQRFWQARPWHWLAACLITALAAWLMGRPYLAVVCILPYLVVWGGSLPLPGLRHAGRWGDPSYGMYLYAFPIQQWVIASTLPNLGFAGSMALSLALTTAMAYLSWHALEKHALRLKPHRSHSARPAPVALQASSAPQASPPTP